MRHQYLFADGLRFHYVEAGTGPLIVLLAGFPQSSYAWRRVMPLLSEEHRVVAVDLPGQGDSDRPVVGYDAETTGPRLRAFLRTLGVEDCVLVGHDVGAWMTFRFASRFPELLRGIVLLDTHIPGVTMPEVIPMDDQSWKNWHFLFNAQRDLAESLLSGRERILLEWFFRNKAANASEAFSKEDVDEYERVYATFGGLRGMLEYYRAVPEDMRTNARLRTLKLTVPALMLGGKLGLTPELCEALRPYCSDIRGGQIAGARDYIAEKSRRR